MSFMRQSQKVISLGKMQCSKLFWMRSPMSLNKMNLHNSLHQQIHRALSANQLQLFKYTALSQPIE